MALATTTLAGEIRLAGDLAGNNNAASPALTNTAVVPGTYCLATITVDSKGRITSAASGTPEVNIATTTTPGVVQVGEGLQITAEGLLTARRASNTTFGVVRSGNTNHIAIVNGEIDVGPKVIVSNRVNTMERNFRYQPTALQSSGSIPINGSLANYFTVTLSGTSTFLNPTNLGTGKYVFIIRQDGTVSRSLTFGTAFKFPTGANTLINPAPNSVSILECVSDGTDLFCEPVRQY